MSPAVCLNCGSRAFRADRSLAGRLVCQRCGLAAGTRPSGQPVRRSTGRARRTIPWRWIGVMVLVAVVVIALF